MSNTEFTKNKEITDREYVTVLRKALETQSISMKVADAVLTAVAIVGLASIAVAAPNALQLLKPLLKKRNYSSRQIRNAFDSLRRQEKVQYVKEKNGEVFVKITKQGQTKLRSFSLSTMKINPQKNWDGKWRLILFDIPVRFKPAREAFRWKLKQLGFIQLQRSVWVFPYPCEDELLFVSNFFEVGKFVEIITASSILNDKRIKKHFHLD